MTESRDDNTPTTPPRQEEEDTLTGEYEGFEELEEESRAMDTIPAPAFDPLAGTLLDGRYLLHDSLGEGGMGAVYRATHVLMDKPVAVKLIHAELAHMEDITKRFEREARSSSRLSDPHCITVTDFGRTEDGTLFLVMELLEGEPLDVRLENNGGLPPAEAVRITCQMLKGLTHAHEQGVVHRDLKPENVYLITHGDEIDFVKILDFGIAKMAMGTGEGESLTRSGVVFGTPKYLSPEQALGDTVDHRADIYAVGIMFYEMLTGEPPFAAESAMDTLSLHLTADPPLLAEKGDYARGLQDIVNRAMAKRPSDRFANSEEFIAALKEVDPDGPPPSGIQEVIGKIAGKRETSVPSWEKDSSAKGIVIGVVLALLLLGGGAGAYLYLNSGDPQSETTSDMVGDLGPKTRPVKEMLDLADTQLRAGNAAEAVITAKEVLVISPDLAPAKLVLGHGLFLSGERLTAMDTYDEALTADVEMAADVRLNENLREALQWQKPREKGAVLLARHGGKEGVDFLAGLCNSALTEGEVRRATRAALVQENKGDVVDWLSSLTADFHELKKCKQRRQIVTEMEKTGDLRFMPLLEQFRPVTTKGRRGKKKTSNGCIGADVLRAIASLNGETEDAGPTP